MLIGAITGIIPAGGAITHAARARGREPGNSIGPSCPQGARRTARYDIRYLLHHAAGAIAHAAMLAMTVSPTHAATVAAALHVSE